jgi:DNA-binding transcriptional LysR family regulator
VNTTGPIRDTDLDVRSLRAFVAVAEELSFTRAAERLFIAQQAISRAVRQLEARLGTPLFVRTTRQVTLTPEGRRLLPRARRLVALHDEIVDDVYDSARPIVIDLLSEGRRTGPMILAAARAAAPELEFRGRYGGGVGAAIRRLLASELDVALGRAEWQGGSLPAGIEHRLVRFEPLAVLLPEAHPLAALDAVPIAALSGVEIDVNPAHAEAQEWSDIADQLVQLAGAVATPPHLPAVGAENQSHHLTRQGIPILTGADHVPVPGGVVRRLVEPIPVFPWSLLWRRGLKRAFLAPIERAARRLAEEGRWLELPDDAWLPEPEASRTRPA